MKILHITNDFCHTRVHVNLYKMLDEKGVEQIIYNPVRDSSHIGRNSFEGNHTKIIYSNVVKPIHKFVYHIKRCVVFKDMLKKVNVKSVNLSHASTLFTDGGLAYKLYKKYNIPYVVAVRNTDINGFMGKLPNTWIAGLKILLYAERIFFISEGLKRKFESHFFFRPFLGKIKHKFVLLPNGIEDCFLDHICHEDCYNNKILYVGDFSDNKNVIRLGNAVLRLRRDKGFENTTLTLVGGGRNTNDKVERMLTDNPEAFKYIGKIYDKEKLCELYRSHSMFAMPSIYETFGLVYLEALSQNLPVLFTKGQGIDGLFAPTVGEGVNPILEDEIYYALKKILSNRKLYSNKDVDFENFRWKNIAEKYIEHYKDCLGACDVKTSLLGSFKKWVGVVKKIYYKLRNNRISITSEIGPGTHLRNCIIGKHCYIGQNGVLNDVEIGNYTCIAPSVQIGGMEHSYWYPSMSPKLSHECISNRKTIIGHDVWIAASAIIKQGVKIGDGAVIGANSFVNKNVPPYAIVVGTPAIIIKYRYTPEQIGMIESSRFWELPPREARGVLVRINEKINSTVVYSKSSKS